MRDRIGQAPSTGALAVGLVAVAIFVAAMSPLARAGAILNTLEGYQEEAEGWTGGVDGLFSGSGGNTESIQLEVGSRLQWLGERDRLRRDLSDDDRGSVRLGATPMLEIERLDDAGGTTARGLPPASTAPIGRRSWGWRWVSERSVIFVTNTRTLLWYTALRPARPVKSRPRSPGGS